MHSKTAHNHSQVLYLLCIGTRPAGFYLQFRNSRNHFKEEQDDLNILSNLIPVFLRLHYIVLYIIISSLFLFFCSKETIPRALHRRIQVSNGLTGETSTE